MHTLTMHLHLQTNMKSLQDAVVYDILYCNYCAGMSRKDKLKCKHPTMTGEQEETHTCEVCEKENKIKRDDKDLIIKEWCNHCNN